MIAETHGKISRTGSNLSENMEDKLTGNFFGRLRYLPYSKGLKILLENLKYEDNIEHGKLFSDTKKEYIGDNFHFWKYSKIAELDLIIELSDCLLGIEVKYNSRLSGNTQLKREFEYLFKDDKNNYKNKFLIFISRVEGLKEALEEIENVKKMHEEYKNIKFAYISWEDIFEIYNKIDLVMYNDYEKLIIVDIITLLKYKDFERFRNFKIEDRHKVNNDLFFKFDYYNFKFKEFFAIIEGDKYYEFNK